MLRLANLDYKEFQGDEGVIMVRAAQALTGDEMALLRHQKGPVEILLAMLPWGLVGSIDELWARAVFAWGGWLVVPAVAFLGRRWFGRPSGLVAALLFAIGGFGIAFSRIVQYQSLVMLWVLLSLIHADRYRRNGASVDLALSASFLSGGLLAHYDAILAAPAVAWLVVARWRRERAGWPRHAALATATGLLLLALFYAPYLASPTLRGTGSYLLQDRVGGTLFSWSFPQAWRMATFYNSTYYVIGLLFLAIVGLAANAKRPARLAATLFLLVPVIFYTLVVADPRTHVYTMFPALALFSGAGATLAWRRLKGQSYRLPGFLLFALFVVASLAYVVLLFVDVEPERQRTWAENRPRYYPTTWSEPPQYGLFGFPHQAGWRVAPALIAGLPYSSNEEPEVTNWYLAQAERTQCPDFETFFLAGNAQDALPYDEQRLDGLALQTVVTVNDTPAMRIYGENSGETTQVEATGSELWRMPAQVAPPLGHGDVPVGTVLGNKVKLLGYTLEPPNPQPGATLDVVLYWQALVPIDRNYQVFVHLYDGTMWAQHDGAPDCAIEPTSGWEAGEVVRDAHRLQLSPDIPSGRIPLLVGMYDLIGGMRLTVPATGADNVHLADLRVGVSQ
jgi:hypothetical protein